MKGPLMTIDDLIIEALTAKDHFWFIQSFEITARTDATVTLRFIIETDLFIQIFFSQRSGRFNLALIGASGRLYGRDKEHGFWHRHPFSRPEEHEATPDGVSLRPINQFLAESEEILITHNLI